MDDNPQHPQGMTIGPDTNSETATLAAALTEKEKLYVQKGRFWAKSSEKRIQLKKEIAALKTDLERAHHLASGAGQAADGCSGTENSRRSSMSLTDDFRAQSPLTPSPSSKPGSPQPDQPEALPVDPDLAPQTPSDPVDLPALQLQTTKQGGTSNDALNMGLHGTALAVRADADLRVTSVQHMDTDENSPSIVERYMQMSSQMRSMREKFDADEQRRALANQAPYYTSELTHALGTPPKQAGNWTPQWGYYIAQHEQFDNGSSHMNNNSGRSGMSTNFGTLPMNFDQSMDVDPQEATGPNLATDVLHAHSHPSETHVHSGTTSGMMYDSLHPLSGVSDTGPSDGRSNLPLGTNAVGDDLAASTNRLFDFGQPSHNHHATNTNMLSLKSNNAQFGKGAEESAIPRPLIATPDLNQHILPTDGAGEHRAKVHLPPSERRRLSILKIEAITQQILTSRSNTAEAGRAKRTRPHTLNTNITSRPIPVDMSEMGPDQYKVMHFNWGSYDNTARDREVFLEVLEGSVHKHTINIANQQPSSFEKNDIFKRTEIGVPFEALPIGDQVILNARGRVAIRHFLEEVEKEEELISMAKQNHKNDLDDLALPPTPHIHPNWVKRLALNNATYLPESATTSVRVSLEFLTNAERRIGCRYHLNDRFSRGPRDGPSTHRMRAVSGLQDLHGTAHPSTDSNNQRQPGHAHCGCSLLDILLDWYLYKTRGATSTNENPHQGLMNRTFYQFTPINPTPRAYYHATFTALTGFDGTSDELYTGTKGWGPEPGDWKTSGYDFSFNFAVVEYLFGEMGVDPWVVFKQPVKEKQRT